MGYAKIKLITFTSIMLMFILLSYFYVDQDVALYFIKYKQTYQNIGRRLSILGESQWYIGSAIIGMVYYSYIQRDRLYRNRFLLLLNVNLFSGVLSILFKIIIGRSRPWALEHNINAYGFLFTQNEHFTWLQRLDYQITMLLEHTTLYESMPSGHATTTAAVFTYMMILFPKKFYIWVPIACTSLVARVLANAHYVGDLLSGILLGTLATLFVYSKMKKKFENNKEIKA